MIIAWYSAGITSAVACRLAVQKYTNVKIIYINIASAHEDNERFIADCEHWYGQKIERVRGKYADQFEVIYKKKYINGVHGAPCTYELKKKVRQDIEAMYEYDGQVFGFEFSKREVNRAVRFEEQYPNSQPIFPLIENKLNKNECAGILASAGIEIPKMYKLGFNNNNCIGCVKGGAGYWNHIRKHFPDVFAKMSDAEKEIGASCLKIPLAELHSDAGNLSEEVAFECGLFCEIDFADIISPKTEQLMK